MKGYPSKAEKVPEPAPKMGALTKIGLSVGVALGLIAALSVEALLVWVILAYLLKANLVFSQVFGSVLLVEYVISRIALKVNGRK